MIPVALDSARLRLGIAGNGQASERRRARLIASGADPVALDPRAPDFGKVDVLWIADLPDQEAALLARAARRAGVLVNVEDRPELCDFHSVAELRRGALLIGVSTSGESPALARRIRDQIAARLGPEWATRVARIGALRRSWRDWGHAPAELTRLTDAAIDDAGWLT